MCQSRSVILGQMQQVYSLGFRIEDLVEEPASLRAREAPLPRPFDDAALGGNVTAAAGVVVSHITRGGCILHKSCTLCYVRSASVSTYYIQRPPG